MNKKVNLHNTTPSRLGEVVVLFNARKPTQTVKDEEETENYIPNERIR